MKKARGRPRRFDTEEALSTAQALFHDRGYDAVGVAELTEAIGISPPSFYAAFGSKASLFGRVLDRYQAASLKLSSFVAEGRPPANVLRAYLLAAARLYAADPAAAGCLVLESARGLFDAACTAAARERKRASRDAMRTYLAGCEVANADAAADFVAVVMSGLSAASREGWDEARLVVAAETAAAALATMIA